MNDGSDSLSVLASVVDARARYLATQTKAQAVDATVINVLQSLRADTSTAKKRADVIEGRYIVEVKDTGMTAAWAQPRGKFSAKGHRAVRPSGGGTSTVSINGYRVVNLAGTYKRCPVAKVYALSITNADAKRDMPFYPARADRIYCMAANEADVRRFAEKRIRRRIGQYRGISRRALGAAMHALAVRQGGGSLGGDLGRLAAAVANVERSGSGYDSGIYGVHVEDNLPHALDALKSGSIDLAVRRACNRTVAIINRNMDGYGSFAARIPTPFPEVSGAAPAVPVATTRETVVRVGG